MITFGVAGDDDVTVRFTDDRGNEKTVNFANYNSGYFLADSGGDVIMVNEGRPAYENEYLMVDSGDFGHIFEITDIDPAESDSTGTVSFKDIMSGTTISKTLPKGDNTVEWIIDGQTYYLNVSDDAVDSLVLTWGPGATYADVGNDIVVFPTIETSKGALIAITDDITINTTHAAGADNTTNLTFPGGAIFDMSGDVDWTNALLGSGNLSTAVPQITYNVTIDNTGANYALTIGIADPATNDRFTTPAIVILEEEDEDNEKNAMVVDTTYDTSNTEVEWNQPLSTNSVGQAYDNIQLETDSKVTEGFDEWGTKYSYDTDPDQPVATIYYPDYQAFATAAFGSNPTFAIGGEGGAGTVEQAILITSPVGKLDSEINTATLASDLILVGGPCANTLVATLAEDNTTGIPACGDWALSTGLIKEVADAFSSGQKALVVAGTTADDTRSLAARVMSGTLDYAV
jgi:hypothetical protein